MASSAQTDKMGEMSEMTEIESALLLLQIQKELETLPDTALAKTAIFGTTSKILARLAMHPALVDVLSPGRVKKVLTDIRQGKVPKR